MNQSTKEMKMLRTELRKTEVGLVCCIDRRSSRLGMLCYAYRSSRCTASLCLRRESLWIDIEVMAEESLNRLRDRDRIQTPTVEDQHTYITFHILTQSVDQTLHPTFLKVLPRSNQLKQGEALWSSKIMADRCRIRFPARSQQHKIGMPSASLGRFGDSGRRSEVLVQWRRQL